MSDTEGSSKIRGAPLCDTWKIDATLLALPQVLTRASRHSEAAGLLVLDLEAIHRLASTAYMYHEAQGVATRGIATDSRSMGR